MVNGVIMRVRKYSFVAQTLLGMTFLSGCATVPESNFTRELHPSIYATVVGVPSEECNDIRFERINGIHSNPNILDTAPNAVMVAPGNNTITVKAEGQWAFRELSFPCSAGKTYLVELTRNRDNEIALTLNEALALFNISPPIIQAEINGRSVGNVAELLTATGIIRPEADLAQSIRPNGKIDKIVTELEPSLNSMPYQTAKEIVIKTKEFLESLASRIDAAAGRAAKGELALVVREIASGHIVLVDVMPVYVPSESTPLYNTYNYTPPINTYNTYKPYEQPKIELPHYSPAPIAPMRLGK